MIFSSSSGSQFRNSFFGEKFAERNRTIQEALLRRIFDFTLAADTDLQSRGFKALHATDFQINPRTAGGSDSRMVN